MTPVGVARLAVPRGTGRQKTAGLPWGKTAGLYPLAVFAAGFVLLFLRRPETLTTAEFFGDDAHFYQDARDIGPQAVTMPYAGYLSIVQRVVALIETIVPPVWAPVIGNAIALAVMAVVAAFLASHRMSALIPDRLGRIALAIVFVMLPAAAEVTGAMRDVQWVLGVYLIAMLVATSPATVKGRYGDAVGLMVAGFTGPTAILLLPLFTIRAWRDRSWRWHLFWVSVAGAAQLAILSVALRTPPAPTDWALVPQVMLMRDLVVPLTGMYGPGWSPLTGLVVIVALVAAAWHLPRSWLLVAMFIVLVIPIAGIRATETPTASMLDPLDPGSGGRYFYLSGVVFAGLIVVALTRRNWLAIPAAALLCLGIVVDARLPAIPPAGWAQHAACIGGPVPCTVAVQPEARWAVHWP